MKRKAALLILVLVVLGSALAACASATSTTEQSAVATETTTTDTNLSSETSMDAPPEGSPPEGSPPEGGLPGGGLTTVDTGTGAYVLTDGETLTGGTFTSTNADENAIRAEDEVTASLEDVTVEKTDGAASSNDASSFTG